MYKNILVPMALDHDVSPQTLAVARCLLEESGEIRALHVYEALQGAAAAYIDKGAYEEGVERARKVLAEKTADHPDLKAEVVEGHSYRTIIDYAAEHDIDCIVIGSHRPGLSDYLIGSTAARVVRHAGCAVHVHRSH